MLEILDTGSASAEKNMLVDSELLERLNTFQDPILHLYSWSKPSISFGYFIDIGKYIDVKKLKEKEIDFARRPTGGGIVFHLWDYAFSFLMPRSHRMFSENTLENYRFVNSIVLEALKGFLEETGLKLISQDVKADDLTQVNFCMAHPTKYDVILDGKKVAGASQRKTKNGYLHQGTISIGLPKKEILKDVLLHDNILKSMLKYSFAPLGFEWDLNHLEQMREKIKNQLIQKFQITLSE